MLEIGDFLHSAEKHGAITPAARYAAGPPGGIAIERVGAAAP
jgi:hypothetical protein